MQRRYLVPLIAGIVIFWAVMTGLLLKREAFIPRLTPDRMAGAGYSDVPTDTWMAIKLSDGKQVGYVNVRTEPESRDGAPGTSLSVLGRVRLSLFGDSSEMIAMGETWVSRAEGVRDFTFNIRSSGHEVDVRGAVDGGVLRAEVATAGESYPIELPIDKNLRLTSGIGFNTVSFPALEPGDTFQMDTFDPITLSTSQAKISCTGVDTVEIMGEQVTARVVTIDSSGIATRAWISENGEVLRAETPVGFLIERVRQEDALGNLDTAGSGDSLGQLAAVRATGAKPFRGAKRMTVAIKSDKGTSTIPQDDTQSILSENQLAIQSQDPPSVRESAAIASDEHKMYLAGDPFIQVDSPRIREQAQRIVGGVEDDWNKALRLHEWVYDSIEKAPVLSVPSALDVLEKKKGDCNEHTVLYTALARASGIPTRIAIGVVWSEEYEAFYYHAWPEVFIGRWIWMDPTLGQPIADATHIKLLTGGIENWWQLVPYLGTLEIHIAAIE
ncbi:MAG: transglutaminase-like domain-containing protein [Candidatus Hydrogenedentes bacterium]|nr:transglutaminase-like domain-containing protein [Candidatus Hydrogenedentota bacterium]